MRKTLPLLIFLALIMCSISPVSAQISPIRTIQKPTVAMTVQPGTGPVGDFSFSSVPSGASFVVDKGEYTGTTPFTIHNLAEGSHYITITMAGYLDLSDAVYISPGVQLQKTYTLTPIPTQVPIVTNGFLTVDTSPSEAVILVDGGSQGTTPLTRIPLDPGSHTIQIQKSGYTDATDSVIIIADLVTVKSYTLGTIPEATTVLVTARITATPREVVPRDMPSGTTLDDQLKALGPVTFRPISISVGNRTKKPILTTLSPYYRDQFNTEKVTAPVGYHTLPMLSLHSYIEVDTKNSYLPSWGNTMAVKPAWGDDTTTYISKTESGNHSSNFRWISVDPTATALYQVSRYPFSDDATHWQNQYVPGLIASGPAKDEPYTGSDGYHYFRIEFAEVANHKLSDPPYYTGIVKLEQTVPGQGTPMGLLKIPFINTGIWTKHLKLGPLTLPMPDGIVQIPDGEPIEQDLGNPNTNMVLRGENAGLFSENFPVAGETGTNVDRSWIETMWADGDHTYYVRIVPIDKDGHAGAPTIPVTVTVARPRPCPTPPASGTFQEDVIIKPPSAQVVSFYTNRLIPDWIQTYQDGSIATRSHFVTVATPPACLEPVTGNQFADSINTTACSEAGGAQPGYHYYKDPPKERGWSSFWDIVVHLFEIFETTTTMISKTYDELNNLVVKIAAYTVQGLTVGQFDCNANPICTGVLHAGLSAAESALGIPPTIPNAAELENMGADYMATIAAEELGAGGLLDTAKDVYGELPSDAKDTIKGHADEIGAKLGDSRASQSNGALAKASGNWFIPDPLYYQPHPATVIIKVTNENDVKSDPVSMVVKDSAGLYRTAQMMAIPALKPHDSTVIPVVMDEDFSRYTAGGFCGDNGWTTSTQYEDMPEMIPCYMENWAEAASKTGTDTFFVTYSARKEGFDITGLTPSSSGKTLSSMLVLGIDEEGKTCPAYNLNKILKYPAGWKMQQTGLPSLIESDNYLFTEGEQGRMIAG